MPAAYTGPAELTPPRLLTSWTFDPTALVVVAVLAAAYLYGMARARSRGERWSYGRASLHGLALVVVVLATMSFIGVYQHVLFWVRAVQVMLLLMLAPLLLALAKPISLAIAALPDRGGRVLKAVIGSRVLKALTFPLLPVALSVGTGFVLYFSPWYTTALTSGVWNHVLMVELLVSGFPFFWTLLRADPVPVSYPYLVGVWIAFVEVAFDAALGLSVMLGHPVAAEYYQRVARPWGFSLQRDQSLGGGALWFVGDMVGLPFLIALFRQMLLEDRRQAREIDRQLDAEAAAQRAAAATEAGGADTPDAAASGGPVMSRPWWESDPVLARRYGRPLREND